MVVVITMVFNIALFVGITAAIAFACHFLHKRLPVGDFFKVYEGIYSNLILSILLNVFFRRLNATVPTAPNRPHQPIPINQHLTLAYAFATAPPAPDKKVM